MGETFETIIGKTKESKKFTLEQRATMARDAIKFLSVREKAASDRLSRIHLQIEELQHVINEAEDK